MEETKTPEKNKRLSLKLGAEDAVNLTEEETSILLSPIATKDSERSVEEIFDVDTSQEDSDQAESDSVHDYNAPQTMEEALELIRMREKEALLAAKMGKMLLESNKQLSQKSEELSLKVSQLETQAQQYETTIKSLEKTNYKTNKSKQAVEEQLREAQTANSNLLHDILKLEEELAQQKANSKEHDTLCKRLKEFQNQIGQYEEELYLLKKSEAELKEQLKQERKFVQVLKQRHDTDNHHLDDNFKTRIEGEERSHKAIRAALVAYKINDDALRVVEEILEQNTNLKKKLAMRSHSQHEMDLLKEEVEELREERNRLQQQLHNSSKQIETMHQMIDEQRVQLFSANLNTASDSKNSILSELEDQVVRKVQAELHREHHNKEVSENKQDFMIHRPLTPVATILAEPDFFQNDNNNRPSTAPSPNASSNSNTLTPTRTPSRSVSEGNLAAQMSLSPGPWVNFITYFPALKSSVTTKELIQRLSNEQLVEFADVLQRVVKAYSTRLVDLLEERDDLRQERDWRVSLVHQIQFKHIAESLAKDEDVRTRSRSASQVLPVLQEDGIVHAHPSTPVKLSLPTTPMKASQPTSPVDSPVGTPKRGLSSFLTSFKRLSGSSDKLV